ncbi:DUF952 domain-containing protein [Rhodococcus sp. NPDC058505]|uniref:DUF952 domain-containing protein n=1 Tax=unclassified Rhodococcus (in: high G+C Gram-positive bacteria) TaxID=192944 RepID=UPI003665C6A4
MCTADDWARCRDSGRRIPDSVGSDGFVHLSTTEQVQLPANRLFLGRDDIVLLYLDAARLGAELRWEPGVPTDPASMRFPHLYGPLPAAAVTAVVPYLPGPDGMFPAADRTPRPGHRDLRT